MAMKVDYVVKETGTNLVRNVTLTLATMITIAVTLAMVGGVRLIDKGLSRSEGRFRGNVEFIVFMDPKASQEQVDAIGHSLQQSPQVKTSSYLDHDAAFGEFKSLFSSQPELVNNITADILPTNYKVQVRDGRSEVVQSLVDQYKKQPGVLQVIAAPERIKQQQDSFDTMTKALYVGVGVVGVASLVLIVNSIRIAMFARRREIEVMKLVGATNWFIRVPFMVEGLIQGVVGAVLGTAMVWGSKAFLLPALQKGGGVFAGFKLTNDDVVHTAVFLLVGGIVVGVLGSALAVSRFLDV